MTPFLRSIAALALASIASAVAVVPAVARADPGRDAPVAISLNDAVALSVDDVWAAGSGTDPQDPDNSDPAFEHWDGTSWTLAPSDRHLEDAEAIFDVSAVTADDVWAVGSTGQPSFNDRQIEIMHWDGTIWSFVPPVQASFNNELFGVAAVAPDDVWAVGGLSTGGTGLNRALVEHWDGSRWSQVSVPDPPGTESLRAVSAASSHDVWAVGTQSPLFGKSRPVALHWDGSRWSLMSIPTVAGRATIPTDVLAISAGDAWAVGSAFNPSIPSISRTVTIHWDGISWNMVASADTGKDNADGLSAITAIGTDDAWTVGNYVHDGEQTLTEHWDGTRWTIVPAPPAFSINGAAAAATDDVWAVGWMISRSVIEHWDGSRWSVVPSP